MYKHIELYWFVNLAKLVDAFSLVCSTILSSISLVKKHRQCWTGVTAACASFDMRLSFRNMFSGGCLLEFGGLSDQIICLNFVFHCLSAAISTATKISRPSFGDIKS